MDTQKLRQLLDDRDRLDAEIAEAVGTPDATAAKSARKTQQCGICGDPNHNARNCPAKIKEVTNGQTPPVP